MNSTEHAGRPGPAGHQESVWRRGVSALRSAWRERGGLEIVAPEAPPIVFVLLSPALGTWVGVGAGLLVGMVVIMLRARRGLPIGPGIGGVIGLGVSAYLTYKTGSTAGSFLVDIYIDLAVASVLLLSVLIRFPATGLLWSALQRKPLTWRANRQAMRIHLTASFVITVLYAIRCATNTFLYEHRDTGVLVVTKLVLGSGVNLVSFAIILVAGAAADHAVLKHGGRTRQPVRARRGERRPAR